MPWLAFWIPRTIYPRKTVVLSMEATPHMEILARLLMTFSSFDLDTGSRFELSSGIEDSVIETSDIVDRQ